MSKHAKKPEELYRSLIYIAIFTLLIPYYEIVFNLSTVNKLFAWGMPIMLLFSVAFGLVGYLLVSAFRKPKAGYIASIVWMAVATIPYLVQYFVYRGFKIYYDITTMTGGAKDMVGGFSDIALQLIFSWDGLFKIFLYALPAILFGVFGRLLYVRKKSIPVNALFRCLAASVMVLCHCLGLLVTHGKDVAWAIYKTEYNYQSAVQQFGLLTGMRLDIQHLIGGGDKGEFEEIPSIEVMKPVIPTRPSQPSDTPEVPIEYGYNQLELKLSGGSGEIKDLNAYVSSLTASKQNPYTGLFKDKNLIMITAEAFTAEVIDPNLTPTLYRLANKGIQFTDYYQPASAGTTGGEYQNIFGMLPTASGASFKNTTDHYNYMTIGSQLDRLGYYGKAYHNNTHTFYSRHETHNNLGYSDGFMGYATVWRST